MPSDDNRDSICSATRFSAPVITAQSLGPAKARGGNPAITSVVRTRMPAFAGMTAWAADARLLESTLRLRHHDVGLRLLAVERGNDHLRSGIDIDQTGKND